MGGDFPSGEPRFSQAVTAGITELRHTIVVYLFPFYSGAVEHPKLAVVFCRNSPPDFSILFKAFLIKFVDSLEKKKGEMNSLPVNSDQSRSQLAAQCIPQPHCQWQRLRLGGAWSS